MAGKSRRFAVSEVRRSFCEEDSREFLLACDGQGTVLWSDTRARRMGLRSGARLAELLVPGLEDKLAGLLARAQRERVKDSELSLVLGQQVATFSFCARPYRRGQVLLLGSMVPPHYEQALRRAQEIMVEITNLNRTLACRERELRDQIEAVRRRDVFLAVASHEFNTPLACLMLILNSLARELRTLEPKRLSERAQMALRQVARLTELTRALLDVTRIESGQLWLEKQECDLARLAREAASRLAPEALRARTELRVHASQRLTGFFDPVRLDQALTNLISNAIKYGGGKPVEVTAQWAAGCAQLAVRDQGIGMAPEDRQRVFGLFERAVSAGHYGGLGIGLFIAGQIVKAHGGSIDVQSEPGRGSTFTVKLPMGPSQEEGPFAQALDPAEVLRHPPGPRSQKQGW